MKFIADAMLGRLAKWLRILGYDVLYYPDIDDRLIIKISREQERTVLTRDTFLLNNKGLRDYIFIESNDVFKQLREVKDRLHFFERAPHGRCVSCNGELKTVSHKSEVRENLPEYVYHSYNDFIMCENCGKVYWEGTHHKKFRDTVMEVLSAPIATSTAAEKSNRDKENGA